MISRALRGMLVWLTLTVSACGLDRDAQTRADAIALTGGNPDVGRQRLSAYGCATCHDIPGVRGADAQVGPPLGGIASRSYIAGRLSNTPDHLMRWIRNPIAVDSQTAMPDVGVSAADARHIAAYLYTLR